MFIKAFCCTLICCPLVVKHQFMLLQLIQKCDYQQKSTVAFKVKTLQQHVFLCFDLQGQRINHSCLHFGCYWLQSEPPGTAPGFEANFIVAKWWNYTLDAIGLKKTFSY